MPFSSVAMIENLALVRIASCKALALSSALGPFRVFDMAISVKGRNAPLARLAWIITVFPMDVCALAHTRRQWSGFTRFGRLPAQGACPDEIQTRRSAGEAVLRAVAGRRSARTARALVARASRAGRRPIDAP